MIKTGYFLLLCFGFTLGATCAFTGFRQYPIPPQDIDFKIMKRKANSVGFCGVESRLLNRKEPTGFVEGELLFKSQCTSCHNRNMIDDLTGPTLGNVEKDWAKYPREDLYQWIRNSQKMIADKHPRATVLWDKWQPAVMNNFNLTDEEIEQILIYIQLTSENKYY